MRGTYGFFTAFPGFMKWMQKKSAGDRSLRRVLSSDMKKL
jgi:hypothetical protein